MSFNRKIVLKAVVTHMHANHLPALRAEGPHLGLRSGLASERALEMYKNVKSNPDFHNTKSLESTPKTQSILVDSVFLL